MAEVTRSSRFAITEETTSGTPVVPSGATDYIALQDGFTMEPSFDNLENAELTGSIGQAKFVRGIERPTVSVSHYIRHSGSEATAPNFGLLVDAAMGETSTAAAEYDTVSSSTTTVIKVDTGEGATFERGEALLIKDATNGYSIRPIQSIATDDLTLGFPVDTAPGAGVNLGQAVLYKPNDSSHPTVSCWLYRGNAASVELAAGSRVSEMSIECTAGEFINGSFTLDAIEYFFDPITITSSNKYIDYNEGGASSAVQLDEKTYKDPIDLASAIQTKLDADATANITVTYNSSGTDIGKYTIASDGATFELEWNTGTNSANTIGATLGFSTAADDTSATSYTSDNKIDLTSTHTPSFDDSDPLVAKSNELFIGDGTESVCLDAASVTFTLTNELTDNLSICADSGRAEVIPSGRAVTAEIDAILTAHDAEKFKQFRAADTIRMLYNAGTKSGGNWEAGKCVSIYMPTATIEAFTPSDRDGLVAVNMTVRAFVEDGLGEFYINFL